MREKTPLIDSKDRLDYRDVLVDELKKNISLSDIIVRLGYECLRHARAWFLH